MYSHAGLPWHALVGASDGGRGRFFFLSVAASDNSSIFATSAACSPGTTPCAETRSRIEVSPEGAIAFLRLPLPLELFFLLEAMLLPPQVFNESSGRHERVECRPPHPRVAGPRS